MNHGRIGNGFTGTQNWIQTSPIQVGADSGWVAVSASTLHTVGIRADGSLWS